MRRRTRHQLTCIVCNMLFPACRSDTLYCSDACAQHACRQRQAAKALPPTSGLEVREWNGTPISRRADGYVNATAMAKAGGKHLPHYMANDRTTEYVQALSRSVGIPTDRLVASIVTGPNHQRGTWVHPRLAVDLARWISPAFAVWMDGWFLESIAAAPTPHHHQTGYAIGHGITIHADSMERARHIWRDAVWRQLVKVQPDDLFRCVQV
jgi:hypothetical protein